MNNTAPDLDDLRDKIINQPGVILDDRAVMKALISANEKQLGTNIVDLRGIAMERLETRLDRLEDTHRNVISAAYENLAGTNQVHRAVLKLLEPADFAAFLTILGTEMAECLRVDVVKLVLETAQAGEDPVVRRLGDVLSTVSPGFIDTLITGGRAVPVRPVTPRQVAQASAEVYGEAAAWIRSEALMKIDLGDGRLPGLLVLGAEDPHQFKANQGTDLLTFFAGVFERVLRRWLS